MLYDYWCYSCEKTFTLSTRGLQECPDCHDGFFMEMPEEFGPDSRFTSRALNYNEDANNSASTAAQLSSREGHTLGDSIVSRFISNFLGTRAEEEVVQSIREVAQPLENGEETSNLRVSNVHDRYSSIFQKRTIQEAIENLKGYSITSEHLSRELPPCVVCMDSFEAGCEVKELPCSHLYHSECILPWLQKNNTCPVCRSALPGELHPSECYSWSFVWTDEALETFRSLLTRLEGILLSSEERRNTRQLQSGPSSYTQETPLESARRRTRSNLLGLYEAHEGRNAQRLDDHFQRTLQRHGMTPNEQSLLQQRRMPSLAPAEMECSGEILGIRSPPDSVNQNAWREIGFISSAGMSGSVIERHPSTLGSGPGTEGPRQVVRISGVDVERRGRLQRERNVSSGATQLSNNDRLVGPSNISQESLRHLGYDSLPSHHVPCGSHLESNMMETEADSVPQMQWTNNPPFVDPQEGERDGRRIERLGERLFNDDSPEQSRKEIASHRRRTSVQRWCSQVIGRTGPDNSPWRGPSDHGDSLPEMPEVRERRPPPSSQIQNHSSWLYPPQPTPPCPFGRTLGRTEASLLGEGSHQQMEVLGSGVGSSWEPPSVGPNLEHRHEPPDLRSRRTSAVENFNWERRWDPRNWSSPFISSEEISEEQLRREWRGRPEDFDPLMARSQVSLRRILRASPQVPEALLNATIRDEHMLSSDLFSRIQRGNTSYVGRGPAGFQSSRGRRTESNVYNDLPASRNPWDEFSGGEDTTEGARNSDIGNSRTRREN